MRLSELTGAEVSANQDMEIAGLTADSRTVAPGFLFAALPGSSVDGADYVDQALERGAVAVLAARGRIDRPLPVPLIEDPQPRRRFAFCAARFHGRQPGTIAAVTGTSGKTSVAEFTRQIWQALGHEAASLGTLGVRAPALEEKLAHTTPDPVTLYRALQALADAGVARLALEASSHGLDQCRLDAVRLTAAAFTNLSRDHFDYHRDEADYFRAKRRLFDTVLPADGTAVLPAAGAHADALRALCRGRGQRVLSFGPGRADVALTEREGRADGQRLALDVLGHRATLELPLIGAFQADNVLCAIGLVVACGGDPAAVCAAAAQLTGVRGRLELVARTASGGYVFVDYAHKPDALDKALEALRPHTAGRLLVVFGCGGDRDAGKRPEMGRIAAARADLALVTDDNPRSEDPGAIRAEIMAACPDAIEVGDRGAAIRRGVGLMRAGDVLLVAGKGHEQGQQVGDELRPFDDASEARAAVAEAEGAADG